MRYSVHVGSKTISSHTLDEAMARLSESLGVDEPQVKSQVEKSGQGVAIRGMCIGRIIDHGFAKKQSAVSPQQARQSVQTFLSASR